MDGCCPGVGLMRVSHSLFYPFTFFVFFIREGNEKSPPGTSLSYLILGLTAEKAAIRFVVGPALYFLFHSSSNCFFFFSFFLLHTADSRKETTWSSSVICGHCIFFPPEAPRISSFLPFVISFNLTDTQCTLVSLCVHTNRVECVHIVWLWAKTLHTHTISNDDDDVFFFVVVASFCFCFDWPALCCCCCCCLVRVRASAAHETQRLSCGFHMEQKKKRKQDTQIIIIMIIIIREREREGGAMVHALLIFCFCFYFGSFWSCFFLWWSNSVAARE